MHITPTPESLKDLAAGDMSRPVTMLNLLRFRAVADYRQFPELAPEEPVTGEAAFAVYMKNTSPFLAGVGGTVEVAGASKTWLIGPDDERWDRVLLVKYPSVRAFFDMVQNPDYGAGFGHRTAALHDSRLLPIL